MKWLGDFVDFLAQTSEALSFKLNSSKASREPIACLGEDEAEVSQGKWIYTFLRKSIDLSDVQPLFIHDPDGKC